MFLEELLTQHEIRRVGRFVIRAKPHQLQEDGRWTLEGYYEDHHSGGVTTTPFSANDSFGSRDEAVRHSLDLGERFVQEQRASIC
jgi:hypothetical protein